MFEKNGLRISRIMSVEKGDWKKEEIKEIQEEIERGFAKIQSARTDLFHCVIAIESVEYTLEVLSKTRLNTERSNCAHMQYAACLLLRR